MNLKEFASCILDKPELWDYDIEHGIISLNNDREDVSYLTVFNGEIDISDCYILNSRNINE